MKRKKPKPSPVDPQLLALARALIAPQMEAWLDGLRAAVPDTKAGKPKKRRRKP